ncbi:MAG: hypothetical protein ACT4N4_02630 [Rhodospirillales bacterium]
MTIRSFTQTAIIAGAAVLLVAAGPAARADGFGKDVVGAFTFAYEGLRDGILDAYETARKGAAEAFTDARREVAQAWREHGPAGKPAAEAAPCKPFHLRASAGGQETVETVMACRQPDGSWKTVD